VFVESAFVLQLRSRLDIRASSLRFREVEVCCME